jgi:hypothetical protein
MRILGFSGIRHCSDDFTDYPFDFNMARKLAIPVLPFS